MSQFLQQLSYQDICGAVALLMSFIGTFIYIRSIFNGQTKPHLYTWAIFTVLTTIAFFAQISDNAGPAAWVMGANAALCFIIVLLSFKYGHTHKTMFDKIALTFSVIAILPWIITKDPLLSVIMVSLIDACAMLPTIRKSWNFPWQENLPNYYIQNTKNIITFLALTHVTVTTSLYLVSIFLVNATLIGVCIYRRRVLSAPHLS
jgi:Ca2+/Na+ antiporter